MLSSRPTSVRIDVDPYSLARTPGKALLKSRSALQENVGQQVPMTLHAKGKKALNNTPYHANTIKPEHVFKDPKAGLSKPAIITTQAPLRPLGDKTPFPNRVANHATPFHATTKIAKPLLEVVPTQTPGTLRPSSTRKHIRTPRSGSNNFETPLTGGQHWDVSDIISPEIESDGNQSIDKDDYDEIEYMPPTAVEFPYEPSFALPNYKEIGEAIWTISQSYIVDELPPFDEDSFNIENFFPRADLSLSELPDDNPFATIDTFKATKTSQQRVVTQNNATKTRLESRLATRSLKTAPVHPQPTVSKSELTTTARHLSATTLVAPKQRTTTTTLARPGTAASVMTRPATSVGVTRPVHKRADTISRPGLDRPKDHTSSIPRPASTIGLPSCKALAAKAPASGLSTRTGQPSRPASTISKAPSKSKATVSAVGRVPQRKNIPLEQDIFNISEDILMVDDDFKFAI